MLEGEPDIKVAAWTTEGTEVLQLVEQHKPDVVVLDLELTSIKGTEVIAALRDRASAPKVLVLTAYNDGDSLRSALDAGADGLALKTESPQQTLTAIRQVHGGQLVFPQAARRWIEGRATGAPGDLTPREREVWSLAALLSVKFFEQGPGGGALIRTVGTFTAGFLIRPLGAFVFGRVGDIVGRKYTFLITLSGMGLSTALIGVVPSYAKIGAAAGFILLFLRLIQGLCLGGEYGGAITYVAEHAPDEKRGYYTGWLQTSPTLATPSLIFFGWLSDRIGRKPIILGGFFLAAVTYYPLYMALGNAANPASINYPLSILIVAIMVSYVGMVYGPIGAFLAEYFPARIRYSSVSVPYHIGNGWGGGLVPVITTAAYVSAQAAGLSMSQSLGHALVYPIAVPAVAFLLSLFLMPETRKISIWQPSTVRAPARR